MGALAELFQDVEQKLLSGETRRRTRPVGVGSPVLAEAVARVQPRQPRSCGADISPGDHRYTFHVSSKWEFGDAVPPEQRELLLWAEDPVSGPTRRRRQDADRGVRACVRAACAIAHRRAAGAAPATGEDRCDRRHDRQFADGRMAVDTVLGQIPEISDHARIEVVDLFRVGSSAIIRYRTGSTFRPR